MTLSIIVAMSPDRLIGKDNGLPWRLPADLRRFKRLTMGHHLLMGRRTFESIPGLLPGRTTVVITRRDDYAAPGAVVVHSFDEAVEVARRAGDSEAFVAGGAEIYRQALGRVDRIYLTVVRGTFDGDVYFPEFEESSWRLVSREDREPDAKNAHSSTFLVYEKTS